MNPQTEGLPASQWKILRAPDNTPSSTAHVTYADDKYTLKEAITAGLIHQSIYWWNGNRWRSYASVDEVFFGKSVWHAFWAQTSNVTLTILIPGQNYLDDRARMDMIRAASRDSRFTNVKTETFEASSGWDRNWELREMKFGYSGSSGSGDTSIYHVTNKANRLERLTAFYDPDNEKWSGWRPESVNTLY